MTPWWWGLTIGLGAAVLRHAVRPPVPALARALAATTDSRNRMSPDGVGGQAVDGGRRSNWWRPDPADLAITGITDARFATNVLTTGVAVMAAMVAAISAWSMTAGTPSGSVMLVMLLVAGALALVFPGERVRRQARRRRAAFGHALSTFLDLVTVLLAGGAGIETSLTAAAEAGDGWAFTLLRNELVRARTRRRSPWDGLADLGERLGLPELVDLAATVQLAGEHGARVRTSLATRAAAVRERHLAQVEAEAQAATERMGLPMVLVFVGFIALLGYPALSLVLGGL